VALLPVSQVSTGSVTLRVDRSTVAALGIAWVPPAA
jgi:hypothetical protein